MKTTRPVLVNRLAHSTSPYLQQHAHNPVDWYEWGAEALSRARAEDKPIFLSIGYAACHWCHVMAHESFEDEAIAAVMNEHFINIKVDREQRPDLDEIYMQATMVLNNGQGGWPMSVWLTPELKPFFAGTYFPPTSRYNRAGFKELCERIGEAWRADRARLVEGAEQLTDLVRSSLYTVSGAAELSADIVHQAADGLARAFDAEHGGLLSGATNKFPPSMALDVMLRSAVRRPADDEQRKKLIELVTLTLDEMADGGIYDQLGGGIHRYSTDPDWHVPHFEKMLYDQALVSRIYLDAYQLTGKVRYAQVAREIFDYVLADLQSPEGGFYSTRDADSEGQEGKYYVWTRPEVLDALGPEEGALFCACFDVTEDGNWRDPHEPGATKSVLRVKRNAGCCAKLFSIGEDEFRVRLADAKQKLLAVRGQRVAPGLDDKVLCEWNGLMIASLARGGGVLGDGKYIDAAARAARFLRAHQQREGRLLRAWRGGQTLDTAFLTDYAALIEGLLELYEATFDRQWLDQALQLNRTVLEHYRDEEGGGFFFTPNDHEPLIARSKEVRDGAMPSGNSVHLMNLLRLARMLDDEELRAVADEVMNTFAAEVKRYPWSSERFLSAVDFGLNGPLELAVVGDPAQDGTRALLAQIHRTYLPNRVIMLLNPERPEAAVKTPLLANRAPVDGQAAVYVCRNFTCQRPVTTPQALAAQLAER